MASVGYFFADCLLDSLTLYFTRASPVTHIGISSVENPNERGRIFKMGLLEMFGNAAHVEPGFGPLASISQAHG